ncbi:MAG: carbonic anhydrase [Pseudomonadota bacterium]
MNRRIVALVLGLLAALPVRAAEVPAGAADPEQIRQIVKEVLREYAASLNDKAGNIQTKAIMKNLVQDNAQFMRTHGAAHFSHFQTSQHPRATVITCSDSRVHTHALDASPDGDLFMIRNIGNQISTAEGSVEYGVHHLHTPLLLVVGHVACGAVKAASGDYSKESGPIRNELDTIQIPKGEAGLSSVKLNVNNQVKRALGKFEEDVLRGTLTVVGAVYDFKNEMGKGQGKLNIINVNGETDPVRIAKLELMQGLDAPASKSSRTQRRVRPASPAGEHDAGH